MKPIGTDPEKTRRVLSRIHQSREGEALSPEWHGRVMNSIRALPAQEAPEKDFLALERLVWRFAPVACLLILTMTVILATQDYSPRYVLYEAMVDESMDSLLAYALGSR